MKILTLNTWQKRGPWEARWRVILNGLNDYQPDIVGFQELFDPDWAEEVRREAGYLHMVFSNSSAGLVFLSRFPLRQSACLTMKTQAPSEEYLRYVLYAEADADGRRLALFDTHLSWRPGESDIRAKQVGELLAFIDEKAGSCETAVMGDFNAAPGTPEIIKMKTKGGFLDTYQTLQPSDPGITWDNAHPYVQMASTVLPDRRIDYLFTRNQGGLLSKLNSAEIAFTQPGAGGIYAADHYGLLVEFRD